MAVVVPLEFQSKPIESESEWNQNGSDNFSRSVWDELKVAETSGFTTEKTASLLYSTSKKVARIDQNLLQYDIFQILELFPEFWCRKSKREGFRRCYEWNRLDLWFGQSFVRIGLSATQAPLDKIATYLCGYDGEKPRDFTIIDVDTKRFLDLSTITPVNDLTRFTERSAPLFVADIS